MVSPANSKGGPTSLAADSVLGGSPGLSPKQINKKGLNLETEILDSLES